MYYCHLQLYTCTRERVREGDTEIEERERERERDVVTHDQLYTNYDSIGSMFTYM